MCGDRGNASETIDPEIEIFVDDILQAGAGAAALTTPERRRRAEEIRARWTQGGPPSRRDDAVVVTPHGHVSVRIHRPVAAEEPTPVLVYLHGGGFTLFSVDTHDRIMRECAARSGAAVVGVDYSLSPEVKYPVALDETVSVIEWLAAGSSPVDVDADRLAVGGDSAGANLALSACLKLRDRGAADLVKAMLLFYGFFDTDFTTSSHRRHGGAGKLLTTEELREFTENYVGRVSETGDPFAALAHADLRGLPPCYHVIPECDPLADGNAEMARRMRSAGNDVSEAFYPTATHSFLEAVSVSRLADAALQASCVWLSERLAARAPERL